MNEKGTQNSFDRFLNGVRVDRHESIKTDYDEQECSEGGTYETV